MATDGHRTDPRAEDALQRGDPARARSSSSATRRPCRRRGSRRSREHGRRRRQAGLEGARGRHRAARARSPARSRTCAARASRSRNSSCARACPSALAVTLRGERAYEFLDRLMSVAIPRIRDFRGLTRHVRRPRQLHARRARADHLPRDRLRRDRPGPRPRHRDHDHGQDRRGGLRPARDARDAVRAARARPARPTRPRNRRDPPRRSCRGTMAKTSLRVRQAAHQPKYPTRGYSRCRRCGRLARGLPQVRPLPDLPARARARRAHPRNDEVAAGSRHVDDRPDRRLPDAHAQRRSRRSTTRSTIPSSRLKREMARILQEQGYIPASTSRRRPRSSRRALRVQPQVRRGPLERDLRPQARLASRPALLRRQGRHPARSRAAWAPRSCPRREA